MAVDRQDLHLGMEVINSIQFSVFSSALNNGGSSVSASDKAQAAVLDELETADGGGRVVGKDSGGHSHFPKRLMRSGAKGAESGVSYLLSLAILSPKFQTWSQRAIRITLTVQVKQKNQNSLFFL